MQRKTKPAGKMAELAAIRKQAGIVVPAVRKVLLDQAPPGRAWDVIHPSEMAHASWCPRATWYRMTTGAWPARTTTGFALENVFAEGHAIHAKWQAWMRETGRLWGRWYCPVCRSSFHGTSAELGTPGERETCLAGAHHWQYAEVPLASATLPIAGHEDGALTGDDVLVEVKSVGPGTLRHEAPKLLARHYVATETGRKVYDMDGLWKDLRRPFSAHVRQANVYLWLAREMGLPFDRCQLVYEFKANQQVKEFTVKLSDDIITPLLEKAEGISRGIESGNPPDCPSGGCEECRGYDEESGQPGAGTADGAGRAGSGREDSQPEPAPARPPARRLSPRHAPGRDRAGPARADGEVRGDERLGELPGDPGGAVLHRGDGDQEGDRLPDGGSAAEEQRPERDPGQGRGRSRPRGNGPDDQAVGGARLPQAGRKPLQRQRAQGDRAEPGDNPPVRKRVPPTRARDVARSRRYLKPLKAIREDA